MSAKPIKVTESDLERFWTWVDASGDCWVFTGYLNHGYGVFMLRCGQQVKAHRYSYTALVGPIEDLSLQLDHRCRNRACVNPDHLEPVTQSVNVSRGVSANALKTHCPKGHRYSPENTAYKMKGQYPGRICVECRRETVRRWRAQRLREAS